MKSPSTAILLFTRSAKEEAVFKRISGKKRLNQRFFKALIDHSYQTAQATGLPLFTIDHQQGDTFGERLSHALKHVFDQGFERVITIGNDSPGLTAKHILQADYQLNHNALVLGPAKDGGTYLIGLQKDAFDQEALSQLDWSAENSFDDLKAFAYSSGINSWVGSELADIDNRNGLHVLLNFSGSQFQQLRHLVENLLANYLHKSRQESAFIPTPIRFAFGLKAPPIS